MSVRVMRPPWKQCIVDDLDGEFAMETRAHLCDSSEQRDDVGKATVEEKGGQFQITEADRKKGIRTASPA